MRYRDASHVDLGSFYARRPGLGRYYRIVGYLLLALLLAFADDPQRIAAILVCSVIAWLQAWYRVVGALWRASLVAAAFAAAVLLTLPHLKPLWAPPVAPSAPAAGVPL